MDVEHQTMSKDTYWAGLVDKNPALRKDTGKVSLDVNKMKDIVFQAYERGANDVRDGESTSDEAGAKLFQQLFGRR
jgi:hypothetical protein